MVGASNRRFPAHDHEAGNNGKVRKWRVAAKTQYHYVVTLYKELEHHRGSDQFNKVQMTLEAVSPDSFLSSIPALARRSTGSTPSATGTKE